MFDVTPVTSPKPYDCGPTCLRMLLLYHGVDVPLEQLVEESDMTLAGTTAGALMRAGRAHGVDLQAYSMDPDELVRQDRPAIVHWKHGHWVVFAGLDEDGRVWVCNPDMGRFRMSQQTFACYATGLEDHPGRATCIFAGEPRDLPSPVPPTLGALEDAVVELSELVSANTEGIGEVNDAVAELSEIVSDMAGGE